MNDLSTEQIADMMTLADRYDVSVQNSVEEMTSYCMLHKRCLLEYLCLETQLLNLLAGCV